MARIRAIKVVVLAAIALGLTCQNSLTQSGRTIRLIVPVPARASTDVVARLMAEHISEAHGVSMGSKTAQAPAA